MYQYRGQEDTIAAIATPLGVGGLGVVRISGRNVLPMLVKIFKGHGQTDQSQWPTHTLHHGWIKNESTIVDEVVVALMRTPKSYTGEDVAEISCHGGIVVVRTVLELCLKSGARLAEPGEFTKRAFLNARLDLAQAEAVLDVISAGTEASLRAGTGQLKGELSVELEDIRQKLLKVLAALEALLNFPDEDTNVRQEEALAGDIATVGERMGMLLSTAHTGRILREGLKVVICGKPNVGKSSLLNVLLREPRAIVTDVAGTTRDTLEESANISGVPLRLVDTAGILVPRDKIEEEAVRRARLMVESADIVLAVIDRSRALDMADREVIAAVRNTRAIVALNKSDLPSALGTEEISVQLENAPVVPISALTHEGVDTLKSEILKIAMDGKPFDTQGALVSNLRHIEALKNAYGSLERAGQSVAEGRSAEFVSEDIKYAVNALDAITGRNVDADVVDEIFSRFCIGK